jgi:hypothetical protein
LYSALLGVEIRCGSADRALACLVGAAEVGRAACWRPGRPPCARRAAGRGGAAEPCAAGGAQVKTLPFCRHSFHADCLLPWLRQQGRGAFCPLCKTPVFSQSA